MALFRRILPVVKHIQSARCLIIDHLVSRPDFLLHERDLPVQCPFYLKKTPVEVFIEECGTDQMFIISDFPGLTPTRVGIILPLHIDAENVYPLPFIIDTGAPRFFYLGRRCVEVLRDEGVITYVGDDHEIHDYTLKGYIQYRGQSIKRVYADALPIRYEPKPEDIRANVMGLSALWLFNIWNIRDLPRLGEKNGL